MTLNQSGQEGLKTDEPFSACPELSALTHQHSSHLTTAFTKHKKKGNEDNGVIKAIRRSNSTVRSLTSRQDSSISLSTHRHFNYAEQAGENTRGVKSSHDWSQKAQRLCSPVRESESLDGDGAQGNGARRASAEPRNQSPVPNTSKQCHRRAELHWCSMLLMRRRQLPRLSAIPSSSAQSNAQKTHLCRFLQSDEGP